MIVVNETAQFSYAKKGKEINEDAILNPVYDSDGHIVFAIADGVGSTSQAHIASSATIKFLQKIVSAHDFTVKGAMQRCQSEIARLAAINVDMSHAATTLTIVQVRHDKIIVGHAGDTRVYYKNESQKLIQLTSDHTRYQEMLDQKEHGIKKLRMHKERLSSTITKAVSAYAELNYDLYEFGLNTLKHNDEILLCLMSDGAYNFWSKRPSFAKNTMSSPLAFVNALKKRIANKSADDFSCLSVKIQLK